MESARFLGHDAGMTIGRILIASTISLGLQTASSSAGQPVICGKDWINIHQNATGLIGVYVQQLPDNHADAAAYRGRHPSMVIYVFSNGKAHQLSYTPDGQLEAGFWWNIPAGNWIYKKLERNFTGHTFCHSSAGP